MDVDDDSRHIDQPPEGQEHQLDQLVQVLSRLKDKLAASEELTEQERALLNGISPLLSDIPAENASIDAVVSATLANIKTMAPEEATEEKEKELERIWYYQSNFRGGDPRKQPHIGMEGYQDGEWLLVKSFKGSLRYRGKKNAEVFGQVGLLRDREYRNEADRTSRTDYKWLMNITGDFGEDPARWPKLPASEYGKDIDLERTDGNPDEQPYYPFVLSLLNNLLEECKVDMAQSELDPNECIVNIELVSQEAGPYDAFVEAVVEEAKEAGNPVPEDQIRKVITPKVFKSLSEIDKPKAVVKTLLRVLKK
ncbi:hypothetical protein ACFL3C_04620 [Patescibacteria group bacterium]